MLALRTTNGQTVSGRKSWPLAGSTGVGTRIFSPLPQRLNLLGGGSADYAQLYWSQPWCFAIINKLTRGIARLDWRVYQHDDQRVPTEAPTSVPAKVMRAPFPRAGAFQLKEQIMGSLCVYGNATFAKFRGGQGRTPAEIWPMPFRNVTIIEGSDTPILAYQYRADIGGKPITLLPEDVVHFSYYNPDGKPYGRSPLEALSTSVALENAGQRYALASFGNAARPASFITSERFLTKDQREELKREIDAAYGGVDQSFKVALLDAGLDWKPIGFSMKDSSVVELRNFSREEVCAVYDIPPPLVGILEKATFSNIDTQARMLYQETFAPILSMLDDTWNAQFVYPEDAWNGLFARFDMSQVVRGNEEQRSQTYQRMFQSGGISPNEIAILEGRKPQGNADDPQNPANWRYVPANMHGVSGDGQLVRGTAAPTPGIDPNADPTQIPGLPAIT